MLFNAVEDFVIVFSGFRCLMRLKISYLYFQVDGNVCVIMLSEIVWEKFQCGTGFQEPYVVHFPDYNKGMLIFLCTSSL